MPFTDPIASVSRRNSRASNVSGTTGASQPTRPPPEAGVPSETMSNAGVLSMLKTSTDTGDIGALSFNTSRLPSMPRPTHQRRSHSSHPPNSAHPHHSVSSLHHHHAPSQTSRVSSQWDSMSAHRRGSLASMRSMPPTLAQAQQLGHATPRRPQPMLRSSGDDSRSYSLNSTLPVQPSPVHRSANSLRSRVHDPRHIPLIPSELVPVVADNRSPLVYPTRLRRPGFRSVSPALSEMHPSNVPPHAGPPPANGRVLMPQPVRLPSQAMHRGYNDMYAPDPRQLAVRPPPRTARSSPGGNNFDPTQLPYRPMMMRPPPPAAIPPWSSSSSSPPSDRSSQRPGLTPANSVSSRRYREFRGPGPPPNGVPMAHHMFHNAARQARNLSQRPDTPMTDAGLSPDPPSSRSLPSSSNPPTPKNQSNIRVIINPAFIDPALADLAESPSEPVYSARYFDYIEGIDKPVDETDSGVPTPSVPPTGFVQRVRAMLESKAAAEPTISRPGTGAGQSAEDIHELAANNPHVEASEIQIHELAANHTPRVTMIEEFLSPSELPASPVKTVGTQTIVSSGEQVTQRITREIIKAELGPSSADNTIDHPGADDASQIVVKPGRERKGRLPTGETSRKQLGLQHDDDLDSITSTSDSNQVASRSNNGSASTISVRASLPSGADYALRFTVHLDSTRSSSAETYSKDHFKLDAESVRQRQSGVSSQNKRTPTVQYANTQQPDSVPEEPVSPLKPEDHDVSRHSTVSPMPTQTLGIDDTLRVAVGEDSDQPSIPGSFPDDQSSPPTPQALDAKSPRLPPSSTTATDTTSTNRYSLPGDLSSIGDTTHTTTDMVTDVAVRFSLPQTATSARPQIVDVASSPTPAKSVQESTPQSDPIQRENRAPPRNSVTFADEVAPLAISKRSDLPRPATNNAEPPTSTKNRSIIRKPSPRESQQDPERASLDSTTELRFPSVGNPNGINNRFGSRHLPDLKEESVEDMSVTDSKRNSGVMRDLRFPIPARLAAVKAMQDRRLQEMGERAQARRTLRHRHKTLAEIRDLPSLNFSQMDLVDKLNEALDVRTTRSLEVDRHHDFPNIYCPFPQRPQSTEPLRERYKSFFTKPEAFDTDSFEVRDVEVEEENVDNKETPQINEQEHSDEEDEPVIRSLSPETFLNFAREVNRLSIPSVAGLSERLSELIPGLRNLHSLQLDALLGPWSEHGSSNGNELARPDTVLSNRTSTTVFRALAERAEEIVKNGTHDSVQSTKPLALNKALPLLPESASANDIMPGHTADVKQSYLSGSVSVPTDLGKDVSRPASAVVRDRTPTTEAEVREMLPSGINPIARAARRSLTVSQASSRPWNLDENYPWATDKMEIDLVVPQPVHLAGSSPKGGVLDKSLTKSLESTTVAETTNTTRGIDIGSMIDPNDSGGSPTTEQLTGVNPAHLRKSSKRSIIGSITRKLGFSDHFTGDEESTTQILTTPHHPCNDSTTQTSCQSAGDRYPTSGLSPPDAFNLDEVRSFFSDNSSEAGGRTPSLRMRLAQLKGKRKTVRIRAPDSLMSLEAPPCNYRQHQHKSQNQHQHGDHHHHLHHHHPPHSRTTLSPRPHDGPHHHHQHHHHHASSFASTTTTPMTPTTPPYHAAIGMGRTEFHLKRFGEKLRLLLVRGGELFRSWSWRSAAPASSASSSHPPPRHFPRQRQRQRAPGSPANLTAADWPLDNEFV